MNRKKKQTGRKTFVFLMGISLSLTFLISGAEAAPIDNDLIQPLSFNSIVNSHSLINVDGIAFMCGKSKPTTKPDTTDKTTTTTDSKTKKEKDGNKIVTDQKNSTSRRGAKIKD